MILRIEKIQKSKFKTNTMTNKCTNSVKIFDIVKNACHDGKILIISNLIFWYSFWFVHIQKTEFTLKAMIKHFLRSIYRNILKNKSVELFKPDQPDFRVWHVYSLCQSGELRVQLRHV